MKKFHALIRAYNNCFVCNFPRSGPHDHTSPPGLTIGTTHCVALLFPSFPRPTKLSLKLPLAGPHAAIGFAI